MSLREALQQIKQSDLDDVNKEIEDVERALDELKDIREVIEIRLGFKRRSKVEGTPPRKTQPAAPAAAAPAAAKSAPPGRTLGGITEEYRAKCREYLMANGPTKMIRLAAMCGIPSGSMPAVVNHRWFNKTVDGVALSDAAYAEKPEK